MIAGCTHPGPYRAVQGTLGDSARGDCAVVCCGCGGFQRPAAGRLDREVAEIMRSHVSVSDPWFGTRMDLTTLPDGAGMRLLSAPTLDFLDAHRAAQRGATAEAEQRRDAGWFIGLALVPPWLESKRDEDSGDILVRPRVGWEPSAYEPVDVHAPCAPRPPEPTPLPAATPTAPIACRRCGCVMRVAVNNPIECSSCGQLITRAA